MHSLAVADQLEVLSIFGSFGVWSGSGRFKFQCRPLDLAGSLGEQKYFDPEAD